MNVYHLLVNMDALILWEVITVTVTKDMYWIMINTLVEVRTAELLF